MLQNVGEMDRLARIAVGVLIMIIGLANVSWWGLIGLIPIATGLYRSCPAYGFLKMDTNKSGQSVS